MTQREYEIAKQVADVTGDDIHTIHSRGFSLVDPDQDLVDLEPDLPPQVVDLGFAVSWRHHVARRGGLTLRRAMSRKDEVEQTMYRFLAFLLASCVISSIYLGWAAIIAWVLSAATIMWFFYTATGEKPGTGGNSKRSCRRR